MPVKVAVVDRASLRGQLRAVDREHPRAISFTSLGPPIAGMALRIVDGHGQLQKERTIGRLQVRGLALSPGYYENPEANQSFDADGWFDTGDDGFLDQGELYLTGRSKECLVVRGANYPGEIESVAEEVAGVTVSFTAACAVRLWRVE